MEVKRVWKYIRECGSTGGWMYIRAKGDCMVERGRPLCNTYTTGYGDVLRPVDSSPIAG